MSLLICLEVDRVQVFTLQQSKRSLTPMASTQIRSRARQLCCRRQLPWKLWAATTSHTGALLKATTSTCTKGPRTTPASLQANNRQAISTSTLWREVKSCSSLHRHKDHKETLTLLCTRAHARCLNTFRRRLCKQTAWLPQNALHEARVLRSQPPGQKAHLTGELLPTQERLFRSRNRYLNLTNRSQSW